MDRRSWTLLIALAAIWGSSYLFIKIGLRDLSPEMVAFGRVALAALVLVPIAVARGALRGLRGHIGLIAVLAAVQVAGPFLLIAAAEQHIASSLAGILVATTALFTALLAIGIDHEERSEGLRLAGVGVGFVGVVLLFGVDLQGSTAELLGGLAVLLASFGYSLGAFWVKRSVRGGDATGVVAAVMVASAVELAIPALATAPASAPGAGPLAAVAALGILGTGIGFFIFYVLLGTVGPARTMLVSYIAPVFAVIYGATLLDERLTAGILAGLGLVVGGSLLAAEGRLGRATTAVQEPVRREDLTTVH
jgi:drug/metabolite transporter (DMT)-like permease